VDAMTAASAMLGVLTGVGSSRHWRVPMGLGALLDVDSKDHQKIEVGRRRGRPFTVTAPDSAVRLVNMSASISGSRNSMSISGSAGEGATGDGGWIIPPSGYRKAEDVEFSVEAIFAKPAGTGFDGTPEVGTWPRHSVRASTSRAIVVRYGMAR
jgi:hypothetical protein